MRGPPMPTTFRSGKSSRSASISWLPSRSPDASPATMATVRGRPACSADDATRRLGEEIQQYLQLGTLFYVRRDFLFCIVEAEARFVECFVRALDRSDGVSGKAAPLQTFRVDPERLRSIARCRHVGRNVLQHHGADRGDAVGADVTELMHR